MIRAFIAIALLAAPAVAAEADLLRDNGYSAFAYDQTTGELLYVEEHREVVLDGRHLRSHVVYRHGSGDTIAAKIIDYGDRPATPDFRLDDLRDGYVEGAESRGDSLVLYRRSGHGAELERRVLRRDRPAVVDGGFDKAVLQSWDKLLDGRGVEFEFAVPNKLNSYRFRIRKSGGSSRGDVGTVQLKIEPANFFLRLIVPAIKLTYDRQSRRLMTYVGITNLADSDTGKRYRARIEFDYPPALTGSPRPTAAIANPGSPL